MKSENEWKTYRTRFLIKAKQLNSNLSFTDLSVVSIAAAKGTTSLNLPRELSASLLASIFEDIYVTMLNAGDQHPGRALEQRSHCSSAPDNLRTGNIYPQPRRGV